MLIKLLSVFFGSMVPIAELRVTIPLAIGILKLEWYVAFITAIIGNILPIPIILLFVRKVFEFMKKRGGKLEKIALWFENKGSSKSDKVTKYATFGLFLFVAIPLPGTGAWMGALIASLLNMRFRNAFLSIAAGVLCAGILVTLISCGLLGGLEFLLEL